MSSRSSSTLSSSTPFSASPHPSVGTFFLFRLSIHVLASSRGILENRRWQIVPYRYNRSGDNKEDYSFSKEGIPNISSPLQKIAFHRGDTGMTGSGSAHFRSPKIATKNLTFLRHQRQWGRSQPRSRRLFSTPFP